MFQSCTGDVSKYSGPLDVNEVSQAVISAALQLLNGQQQAQQSQPRQNAGGQYEGYNYYMESNLGLGYETSINWSVSTNLGKPYGVKMDWWSLEFSETRTVKVLGGERDDSRQLFTVRDNSGFTGFKAAVMMPNNKKPVMTVELFGKNRALRIKEQGITNAFDPATGVETIYQNGIEIGKIVLFERKNAPLTQGSYKTFDKVYTYKAYFNDSKNRDILTIIMATYLVKFLSAYKNNRGY